MTRIGILSDIHGNIRALQTALEIIETEGIDDIVVCGDVVGYGAHPNECCQRVRELGCPVVAGNHDWAVAGKTEYQDSFSGTAIAGIEFTRDCISRDHLEWLKSLPLVYRLEDAVFVHSTLVQPDKWFYPAVGKCAFSSHYQDVRESFDALRGNILFVGHSHIPCLFLELNSGRIKVIKPSGSEFSLDGRRAVVDVGSVGRPRTGSKNASLVIYNREAGSLVYRRFRSHTP